MCLNGLFRFSEALLAYEQSLSLNPNDIETLVDKSATEENLGMYDQSQESLEKVLQLDPENDDALFSLRFAFSAKSKFGESD